MKAHELIDSPEKWWDGNGFQPEDTLCAVHAIDRAYGIFSSASDEAIDKLAQAVGPIPDWNDTHTWEEVYSTMKALDI